MSILLIMLGAGAALLLGGRFYAPVIARVLGERPDRETPAVRINDGRDYVPTQTPVVFAHHYASIAGAGPIIGPIIAIYYGWLPALLWVVLGGVFLGAVHDYVATHIAVREGGKNLAVVARRYIGPAAFVMMLVMLVALLVLVCAAFLDLSARALTSRVELAELKLAADQTLFRVQDGQAIIGGIASTSVIVITAFSPLLGYLYLKRRVPVWICSLAAIGICTLSIGIGLWLPLAARPETWKGMISVYVLIAAGLPVWLFLQSRDFINVHILYVGMAFLVVAVTAAAVRGGGEFAAENVGTAMPLSNWAKASASMGPGWPILFITIACGAVSGFHSLCAGGTTCKQLKTERAARHVGYYGMLLESFLAVCVICCIVIGLSLGGYQHYRASSGGPVLTFAMSVGTTAHVGLGLPVWVGAVGAMLLLEGFLVTTLDTAIRLTRYMIEEGWATIFGRYDVFAADAVQQRRAAVGLPADERAAVELVGTGGLTAERPHLLPDEPRRAAIETRGVGRASLKFLKHYWVNSGIAVGLMLLLGLGNSYSQLWPIFGSANQLLAALTLIVATSWLMARTRPVWYTLAPAIFMVVTSVWALVYETATDFVVDWPAKAPLAITAIVVLAMTVGIVGLAIHRWTRRAVVAVLTSEG